MTSFTYTDFLKLIAALVTSIGGASVIILGLSKFFGDFFANKLLGDIKSKHEQELETIKSNYQKELEKTKSDLERAKLLFTRYSEKQFSIYNSLWNNLIYARKQADEVWRNPILEKIPAFIQQLIQARNAIDQNMLLIAGSDFNKLDTLIKDFENLRINGKRLFELDGLDLQALQTAGLIDIHVQNAVAAKQSLIIDCNTIITEIGESFRNQMRG